jgi:hyperosmotically inducible periplasmic protein
MSIKSFTLGAIAGAGAVWFLDPDSGARRRSVATDKAGKYARKGQEEAARKADYAAGAAKGAVQQATPSTREDPEERLNDPALARKVESEIFRDSDAPKGDVSVNVEDGVVYLRGQLEDQAQIDRLGEAAREVAGVQGVKNLLHAPGEPAPAKT